MCSHVLKSIKCASENLRSPLDALYNGRSESFSDEKRKLFLCRRCLRVAGANRQAPRGRRGSGLGTGESTNRSPRREWRAARHMVFLLSYSLPNIILNLFDSNADIEESFIDIRWLLRD